MVVCLGLTSLGPAGVFPLESRRGGEGSPAEASATCFGTSLGWEVSVEPLPRLHRAVLASHLGRFRSPCRQLSDSFPPPLDGGEMTARR